MADSTQTSNGFLHSTFPVLFPYHPALTYTDSDFDAFVKKDLQCTRATDSGLGVDVVDGHGDFGPLLSDESITTTGGVHKALEEMDIESKPDKSPADQSGSEEHPFMKALHSENKGPSRALENMMETENADLAYASTTAPLVDLFSELEEAVSGPRLLTLLEAAWKKDSLATLKIIFNARSIHLGKSSRGPTYKCFGWLALQHPNTLLTNLQWLSRPIIEKKLGEKKKIEDENDMILVEAEKDDDDSTRFDVKNGVSHGYWKDLLNVLALAVDGKLSVLANPRDLLNIKNKRTRKEKTVVVWDADKAKVLRHRTRAARHAAAINAFNEDSFYRGLHLTVARLFASQLRADLALLHSDDKKALRQISLCSKWSPSFGLFHDKHTFIVSSIAEILHPQSEFPGVTNRERYLRYARESYRKDVSALRKALGVVERDIAAEKFENIKYDRIPSAAMNRYANLFAKKDTDRFEEYISKVADGKKRISGATLLPSKLISAVRSAPSSDAIARYGMQAKKGGAKAMVNAKMAAIDAKVWDGQWRTLVQRIKDSGSLENSIAVADVSGSMSYPQFPDGSCPMDSAIGLSLLIAEVTAPPFGGSFITFSTDPRVEKVKGTTLKEKVNKLESADWGMSTDFVAVFDRLILPLATKHKLKQEEMVKQVFVFSDMQFDQAGPSDQWTTSYERIKQDFKKHGYEMPKLIFWNLAGGRAGVTGYGNPVAPKPVLADEEGTALVSGYSQGMLKVFLDNGTFEDPEAEVELVEENVKVEDGDDETVVQVKKKQKMDPMSTVRKAISHKAYDMLKVVD